jgi:hypothetical protein
MERGVRGVAFPLGIGGWRGNVLVCFRSGPIDAFPRRLPEEPWLSLRRR